MRVKNTHFFPPLFKKKCLRNETGWMLICILPPRGRRCFFWGCFLVSPCASCRTLSAFSEKNKQTNTTDYMASKPQGCVSQSLKLGGPRSRCRKVWYLLRGPLLRPSPWRLSQTRRFWGGTNAWYNTATVTVVSISKKGPCPLWKGKTSLESERQTSKINFYDTSST